MIRVNGLDLETYIRRTNPAYRPRLAPTGPRRTWYECHPALMESLPDPVPEAPSAWGLAIILSVLDEPAMPPVMTATEVEAAASS